MTFQTQGIFEVHLSVEDRIRSTSFYERVFGFELAAHIEDRIRSTSFYERVFGFELAAHIEDRDITFLWMGEIGEAMLGLWGPRCPNPPIRQGKGHIAWRLPETEIVESINKLRKLEVEPLGFDGAPTEEAVVLAWMPAISVYFEDPDGHSLEFISMLDAEPKAELGVLTHNEWLKRR